MSAALDITRSTFDSGYLPVDFEEREQVRVIQRRHGARLLLEAAQPVGVGRELGRQRLDRDLAIEPRVARPPDLTHSTGA